MEKFGQKGPISAIPANVSVIRSFVKLSGVMPPAVADTSSSKERVVVSSVSMTSLKL